MAINIFSFEAEENKPVSALNTLFWAGSTTKEITSNYLLIVTS